MSYDAVLLLFLSLLLLIAPVILVVGLPVAFQVMFPGEFSEARFTREFSWTVGEMRQDVTFHIVATVAAVITERAVVNGTSNWLRSFGSTCGGRCAVSLGSFARRCRRSRHFV